jgi:hypothetical protein
MLKCQYFLLALEVFHPFFLVFTDSVEKSATLDGHKSLLSQLASLLQKKDTTEFKNVYDWSCKSIWEKMQNRQSGRTYRQNYFKGKKEIPETLQEQRG